MFLLESLAYVTLQTPRRAEMTRFYRQAVGLVPVSGPAGDGVTALGLHEDRPSLLLADGPLALGEVGFTARGTEALRTLEERLAARGVPFQRHDGRGPGQGAGLSFQDPEGRRLNVFVPVDVPAARYRPRLGPVPIQVQHVTYCSPDPAGLSPFYEEVLGFRVSDWQERDFVWLRTGPLHHTVAIVRGEAPGLDHYAWEVPDWECFKTWCDLLSQQGIEIVWGPGRHGPGNNIFFFILDTDGNHVEFFAEMEIFHDENMEYTPRVWRSIPSTLNFWGPGANWRRSQ